MELETLEAKQDTRGTLVEAFQFPNDGQLMYVIVNPKESRGGHYHRRKTEHFLVIYGAAIIQAKNRLTGDVLRAEVSGYKPMVATIVPNTTHMLTATDEGCIVLIWCDEQYNEGDADTYPEEI